MKKWVILLIFALGGFIVCEKKKEIVSLPTSSLAYQLGKRISPVLSVMDPDSNRVLAFTKDFHVSAGEVLFEIHSSLGNETANLVNASREQLAGFVRRYTRQLVDQKLLVAAAGKAHFQIADSEVDDILDQQYKKVGGEDLFLKSLQKSGMNLGFTRQKIRINLIINRYLDRIVEERISVTEEQMTRAYVHYLQDTTVSVRHILLLTEGKSDDEKKLIRKKMEGILAQAKRGDDFTTLARTHTEDPASGENGGLYENLSRGFMVKPFEDAAFSLPIGEISGLIESHYGYHILKVIKRERNNKTLAEVRPMLTAQIHRQDRDSVVSIVMNELREKAKLEIATF